MLWVGVFLWSSLPQLSFLLVHWTKHTTQNHLVDTNLVWHRPQKVLATRPDNQSSRRSPLSCLLKASRSWNPFIFSCLSSNFLRHSKTWVQDRVLSPYIYWSISSTDDRYSVRCEQVYYRGGAATIWPAVTLVSSRTLNEAYARGSPYILADCSTCPVTRTCCGRCYLHRRT